MRLVVHADRFASQDHRVCSGVRRGIASGTPRQPLTSGLMDLGGNERSRAIIRSVYPHEISAEDNDATVRVIRAWAARINADDTAAQSLCDVLGLDYAGAQRRSESVSA